MLYLMFSASFDANFVQFASSTGGSMEVQGGPKKRPITIEFITALVIDIFA